MLFTDKSAITQLGIEASNCAVIDSACSSTVSGRDWLDNYLSSLHDPSKALVRQQWVPGSTDFEVEQY